MAFKSSNLPLSTVRKILIHQDCKLIRDTKGHEKYSKKTLFDDLIAHGWTIMKKTKPFIAPEITDLINKNEYLHDIVNSRAYRMDRMNVDIPQYATC